MYQSSIAWPALVAGLASSVNGQYSGWVENQVNTTLCRWTDFRVATLKDVVYLDGGHLSWVPGMADGSLQSPVDDNNSLGLINVLNFSTPFNVSTNVSTLFTTLSKVPAGTAANNFAPNYYGGALLHNDDEFFLYGGATINLTGDAPPDGDNVLSYMASQYGDNEQYFPPGYRNIKLPDDVNRYVTYGDGANAPSENKAWYFGGYRTETWGQIYDGSPDEAYQPTNVSNTLIRLDMSLQQQEDWSNASLPRSTPSRAGPSVVWVPVGSQGILVVVGGVTYPSFANLDGHSSNEAQNKQDSPGFMETIDIYDIGGDTWYRQRTVGSPTQFALGCAVLGTAQDYSSFNIYYYGGYDAISEVSPMSDDVYVLSLPSFMWMKVTSGVPGQGRAGHQCVTPYPDQMIAIGGRPSSDPDQCLEGDNPQFLRVYNLTSGHWLDSYDPESWNEYGVPEMIHEMIGGDFAGSATMMTPSPSGWDTAGLGDVFATPYPTTKLTTYYPYSTVGAANGTRGDLDNGGGGGNNRASWLGPVLGVVLGLVFVTAVVVGVLLYRRRRLLRKKAASEPPTDENGNRILSWMQQHQQPSDGKAPTVTTDETRTQLDDMESRGMTPMRSTPNQPEMRQYTPSEMPDTPLVELMDTSLTPELGDTRIHGAGSPFNSAPHTPRSLSTPTSQSFFPAGLASRDHAGTPPLPPPSAHSTGLGQIDERPDSPSLGSGGDHLFGTLAGVASIPFPASSTFRIDAAPPADFRHLGGRGPEASPPLPVSPPSGPVEDPRGEAADYVSARAASPGSSSAAGNPLRRSVFRESEDDLGGAGERGGQH
ncbi:hypothetical protein GGR52DRAFT_576059 [Hypoxylon sp. FL1284]|nr:hypothetical protein GGR52DRAFT_576059 [Hypoxylon sp. FL1284]